MAEAEQENHITNIHEWYLYIVLYICSATIFYFVTNESVLS